MEQDQLSDEWLAPTAGRPTSSVLPKVAGPASPVVLPGLGQQRSWSVGSPASAPSTAGLAQPEEDDLAQRQAMARALTLMQAEKAVAVARQFMAQRRYHQLKAAGVPDEKIPLDVVANAFGTHAAALMNLNLRRQAMAYAQRPAFTPTFVPPDAHTGAPGYMRSGVKGSTVHVLPGAAESGPVSGVAVIDPTTGQPAPGMFAVRGRTGTPHVVRKSQPPLGKLSDLEKVLISQDNKRAAELNREMERSLGIALKDPKSPLYPKAVAAQAELAAIQKRMAALRDRALSAQVATDKAAAGVRIKRKSDGKEFVYNGDPASVPTDKYDVITGDEEDDDDNE